MHLRKDSGVLVCWLLCGTGLLAFVGFIFSNSQFFFYETTHGVVNYRYLCIIGFLLLIGIGLVLALVTKDKNSKDD